MLPPHPRNQPPALGHETDWAKLGAFIAAISFLVRFSGTRPRAGLGITPYKQRGVSLRAFFEVCLQRPPLVPPSPECGTGTFPPALITTTWSGARRGPGWRRFPKFSGPPGSSSSPLTARSGTAPRTWGTNINPGGQKFAPKPANSAGLLRSEQRGRGSCEPGAAPVRAGAAPLLSSF